MYFGFRQTVEHESLGTIRIMHITGAMVKVEKLTGLGHGTKQRVVTAGAFFGFVKTYGGTDVV